MAARKMKHYGLVCPVWASIGALLFISGCGGNGGDSDGGGGTEDASVEEAGTDGGDDAGRDGGDDAAADGATEDGGMETPAYDDPAGASGERLRRRYLEAGPGAYMTVDFWDTELDMSCSFEEAADGTQRCLPDPSGDIRYADAGCTEPVYEVRGCDSGWARNRVDNTYFRKTDSPAVLSGDLYYEGSGGCVATILDSDREYWVAEPVPSSGFVRGTESTEARDGDLVARYLDGDDGSRILVETVHRTRGYACSFDEEMRCVYERRAGVTRYADSGCTEPLYGFRGDSEPAMIPVRQRGSDGCVTGYRYYETGSVYGASDSYYLDGSGSCMSRSTGSTYTYYHLGSEIPLGDFPQASQSLEGEGEIQARRYVDDAGDPLGVAHVFWDTTRDEECDPGALPDEGGMACLTRDRGYVSSSYFISASCSDPASLGTASCVSSAPRLLAEVGVRACSVPKALRLDAVYERGTEVGPDYYFDNGVVECEMRTFTDRTSGWATGAEALDSLPRLELKME